MLAGILTIAIGVMGACTATSDAPEAGPSPTAAPEPSHTVLHPDEYFNLSEADALDYLHDLEVRAEDALHEGDLGALLDIYTRDGEAGREASATIVRDYRNAWENATDIEIVSTRILRITSQLAVFRVVQVIRPCVFDVDTHVDATEDPRVLRQVVTRSMADEQLNWRLHRDVIERSEPTGERADCPPR